MRATATNRLFSGGYLISAILICAEYLRLGIFYRSQHKVLMASFVIKLSFVIIELALAIAFGLCMRSSNKARKNPAAIIEWGMFYSNHTSRGSPSNHS